MRHDFLTGCAQLRGERDADQRCQSLAKEAGAGDRAWRAYLSSSGQSAANARDRIGRGPWKNAKGVVVAKSIDDLHDNSNLNKQTALTEKGAVQC